MYSLISGFIENYFRKIEYKVLFVGLDSSGKTTLVNSIKCLASDNPIPSNYKCFQTIGMNVEKLTSGRSILTLWDLGGDSSFRSVWERYYHESHVVVFVLDASNRARLEEAKMELEKIIHNSELQDSPILVIANKMDMDESVSVDELLHSMPVLLPQGDDDDEKMDQSSASSSFRRARRRAPRPIQLIPVSAKTGDGVHQIFTWLLDVVSKTDRSSRLLLESSRQSV